jgi:DnaJ-class molecular chaperone
LQAQHQDPAAKRHARERFNQIRAAFEVLRDPELRRQYDNGMLVKP